VQGQWRRGRERRLLEGSRVQHGMLVLRLLTRSGHSRQLRCSSASVAFSAPGVSELPSLRRYLLTLPPSPLSLNSKNRQNRDRAGVPIQQ